MTPQEARATLNNVQRDQSFRNTVDIENVTVPDSNISVSILRPKNNRDNLPFVFYIHGEGWVLGGLQTHGRLVSEIANEAGVAVVFVNYSLAPEKKYPTQIIECYESLSLFLS